MNFTLWHNPRCSKSRATLALLSERGVTPEIRHYLVDAPSEGELGALLNLLGEPATTLIRSGDALFKELGLTKSSSKATLIHAMANNPSLIERPVLIGKSAAAIGRPPENVLRLL